MKNETSQVAALTSSDNIQNKAVKTPPSPAEIQAWLVSYLANLLSVADEDVDVKIPFERYGLDSSAAVGLTGDLEDWLGHEIEPTLLYDYPTIESLVKYVSSLLN